MGFVDRYERTLRSRRFWIIFYGVLIVLSLTLFGVRVLLQRPQEVSITALLKIVGLGIITLPVAIISFPLGIIGLFTWFFNLTPLMEALYAKTANYGLIVIGFYWFVVIALVVKIRSCRHTTLLKLALMLIFLGLLTLIGCQNVPLPK